MSYNDFIKSLFKGGHIVSTDSELAYTIMVKAEQQAIELEQRGSNRDLETLIEDSFNGLMSEGGCLVAVKRNAFEAGFNPKKHNKLDPDSYCWDLYCETEYHDGSTRLQFEIKSTKSIINDKFYFNLSSMKRGLDLNTYVKHGVNHTDFLVLVKFKILDNAAGYIITPMYAFNSNHFTKYIKDSDNSSYTHCVDIQGMINLGHAIDLQN